MRHKCYDAQTGCPVEATLELIGGKWKGSLLYHLLDGKKRFNELRRLFPTVTQRILTNQLREMERAGIVQRKIYPEIPPRVEYSLTTLGESLRPLLIFARDWGNGYMERS
jgi:DNA-binding HxlR family transcriptional regulator